MSGIVGVVNFDGRPVERSLLTRMTASLAFRGPDANSVWLAGQVGFGHALLRTTFEAEHESQPLSFDGETWIVADCRVDAREELVAKLRAKSRRASLRRPDVELILHAWHVWGEACVDHLLGDFAFAIWDGAERRLFCARDHMGVRPFYYAHIGRTVVFSNTLDCVRMHPAVSDELNDLAIADFLLFGGNEEPDTTSFASIHKLAPAHLLTSDANRLSKSSRYWKLAIEDPVHLPTSTAYVERFNQILGSTVSDRLRSPHISICMSGGLNSTALAAVARRTPECSVRAVCSTFDQLGPDLERPFARLAADHLGIPIGFSSLDADTGWAAPNGHRVPEPVQDLPDLLRLTPAYNQMSAHGRVVLHGEGPDNALQYEWKSYLRFLATQGRWPRIAADLWAHALCHKRVPLLSTIPAMARARREQLSRQSHFPEWLNPQLVTRLGLRDRWKRVRQGTSDEHPSRPQAYASLRSSVWQQFLEECDASYTKQPLEFRHPFLDIRVLQFFLTLPVLPWCRRKFILRRAMRGALPSEILRRPKTPAAGSRLYETSKRFGLPFLEQHARAFSFGAPQQGFNSTESIGDFAIRFRYAALGHWLSALETNSDLNKETGHEFRDP